MFELIIFVMGAFLWLVCISAIITHIMWKVTGIEDLEKAGPSPVDTLNYKKRTRQQRLKTGVIKLKDWR